MSTKKLVKGALILLMAVFGFNQLSSQELTNDSNSINDRFSIIKNQTDVCVAVYGSKLITAEQFYRAYGEVQDLMKSMDARISKGILNSNAKILIVTNEEEMGNYEDLIFSLLPAEAIFTDNNGTDETIESGLGVDVSTTRLEFMNLVVYYSLLIEPELQNVYEELKAAYYEVADNGYFIPRGKYGDDVVDEIHQNASDKNALKFGTYLFCLYSVYYGNGTKGPEEFTLDTKSDLKAKNPKGYAFMKSYLSE